MFTACSEDNEAIDAKDLELSKSELVFLAEPGEAQTVTFTANADWKATSEQGWILIDTPVGKKGESTVSVSVKQNPEKVSRQGNVIITEPSTGKVASFKVTQEAEGVNFAVDKREGHFITDLEAKTFTEKFNVVANFEYEIQIVDADWINYSINEDGDIVFNVDTRKALPTEAKSVKVNFVSTEEDASTESITILWDGYEPYIKFYSDEECTNEISEVEFDQKGNNTVTYVKSNVPWTFSKEESEQFTSLISYDRSEDMTKGEKLPYAIETTASLFVNYDRTKLSDKDQTLKLKFVHGENVKVLTFSKKGYSIYFDESQFRTLIDINNPNPDNVPTFSALPIPGAPEGNNGLNFDFEVLAAGEIAPILFQKYDESWLPLVGIDPDANCTLQTTEEYNKNLKKYTYRLSVKDRTNAQGSKLNFKLYFAKTIESVSSDRLYTEYFDMADWSIKPEKVNDITTGMDFAQSEYVLLYDFTSDYITKEGKPYPVSEKGGVVELPYTSNVGESITFFTEATIEGDFVRGTPIDVAAPSGATNNMIDSLIDIENWIFSPLKITVSENKTGVERSITLYFAGILESGEFQYFGKFTINQAAASSTTK